MKSIPLLDRAGRRRSPATTPSFHLGVRPRKKGLRYPPDPPTVEEIVGVMRAAGDRPDGARLRGVIIVLWRAGLRISEALALDETDLDRDRGATSLVAAGGAPNERFKQSTPNVAPAKVPAVGELRIRPMTSDGFGAYRQRAIGEYAAEHVRAGDWSPEDAQERAARETDDLLPDGVDTPGVVLLVGETTDGEVGLVWVGPAPRQGPGWWIYDIEVVPEQRGRGFGRALLEAAEREVKLRGGDSVGLNVFGGNETARSLYESSGYGVTSMQMRKRLGP